jgi:hypothetical protein
MGWIIEFIKDYKRYKIGDVIEMDTAGLCIYYCGLGVAKRIG